MKPPVPFMLPALLMIACLAGAAAAPLTRPAPTPIMHSALEIPSAWFVRGDVHGLTEAAGTLVLNNQPLQLPPVNIPRVAAAWYPQHGLLEVVQADGLVDLYRKQAATWTLAARRSPDVAAHNVAVRFSMVPGLLYVLNYDVKKEAELANGVVDHQDHAEIYSRFALTTAAESWHALPTVGPNAVLLDAAYQVGGRETWLFTSPSQSVTLVTAQPPADPFRTGSSDSLAQSVFVLADHRIVVLTPDGWSLHGADGKAIQLFPIPPGSLPDGWEDPVLRDGQIIVFQSNGPGGTAYTLDLPSGKLVARESLGK